MIGKDEIDAVWDEIFNEQIAIFNEHLADEDRGPLKIKIRCKEIFSRLNVTSIEDINSVYEIVSQRIYIFLDKK